MTSKRKKLLIIYAAILILLLLSAIIPVKKHIEKSAAAEHIYSHRGASGEAVEHTFEAYDLAIEYGSKYIEQDLVLSKDGTLYVSHDLSAERITGVDRLYSDMTDFEISNLKTQNNESIHTLQEIFDRYKDKVIYVIELKEGALQIEQFISIVRSNNLEDNIIVQDFNSTSLLELEKIFPEMKKIHLITKQSVLENSVEEDYIDIISVNKDLMTKNNYDLVHKNGKQFNAWTLNTKEEIEMAIQLDIDSYFTNYTDMAFELEMKYRIS